MTKVLVTGGSGFIAAHIVEQLLSKGYAVVTTVRSAAKADGIYAAHPTLDRDRLRVELVPELTAPGAFDAVVQIPGIDIVLHTASPFHFRVTDPVKDLVDPAVLGTTGILKSIKQYAPQVRRVVVTSSFAAIVDGQWADPATVYTERSWNPITLEQARASPADGYRASKTLAEKAAWAFVETEKPGFDLVTVNPPIVIGPVVHRLDSLGAINTSNERVVDALTGAWKAAGAVPDPGPILVWVDVRDVAAAHILGFEKPEAGGQRLFTVGGYYSNRALFDILLKHFPQYADRLPPPDAPGGEGLAAHFQYDNAATAKVLGLTWTPLETSVVDTVNSLAAQLDKVAPL